MNKTRWTLGVVLAAAVSLWGLVEADASPFSSHILSDDLSNMVNGSAPTVDGSASDTTGKDNNGHGNNADGVDSSNKGNSKTGLDTNCDADGTCVDDEIKSGGTETTTTTTVEPVTKTNNGKKK